MKSKIDVLRARMDGTLSKGAESIWYMLFANTVADRLCEVGIITRRDMKEIFERRLEEARATAQKPIYWLLATRSALRASTNSHPNTISLTAMSRQACSSSAGGNPRQIYCFK
ncbi:hypothetical protein [Rhizobium rhizogenes]